MIWKAVQLLWLKHRIARTESALQRTQDDVAREVFKVFIAVPPQHQIHAYWVMSTETLNMLRRSVDPRSGAYPLETPIGTILMALPIAIDDDFDSMAISYPTPAGPEIGPDDDGAFCPGYDSGERSKGVFISEPKNVSVVMCPECLSNVRDLYETPFGLMCRVCKNIETHRANSERD